MNGIVGAVMISGSLMAQQSQSGQPLSAPSTPGEQTSKPPELASRPAIPHSEPSSQDQMVDRIIEREHDLMKFLESRTPIVETYLQNVTLDSELGPVPKDDRYFLGRMDLSQAIDRRDYMKNQSMENRLLGGFTKFFKMQYQPLGFSWMIFVDRNDFDRQHYDFRYDHREFLGDVRCLVFDVAPKKDAGKGRFLGRSGLKIGISALCA